MTDTWTDAGEGKLDVRPADDTVPYGECACDDCACKEDDPAVETDY